MALITKRIYHIVEYAPEDIEPEQLCCDVAPDPDLGYRMWCGKDDDSNITKWLAKDKPGSLYTLKLIGPTTTGSAGFLQHDTNGTITGGGAAAVPVLEATAIGYGDGSSLLTGVAANLKFVVGDNAVTIGNTASPFSYVTIGHGGSFAEMLIGSNGLSIRTLGDTVNDLTGSAILAVGADLVIDSDRVLACGINCDIDGGDTLLCMGTDSQLTSAYESLSIGSYNVLTSCTAAAAFGSYLTADSVSYTFMHGYRLDGIWRGAQHFGGYGLGYTNGKQAMNICLVATTDDGTTPRLMRYQLGDTVSPLAVPTGFVVTVDVMITATSRGTDGMDLFTFYGMVWNQGGTTMGRAMSSLVHPIGVGGLGISSISVLENTTDHTLEIWVTGLAGVDIDWDANIRAVVSPCGYTSPS